MSYSHSVRGTTPSLSRLTAYCVDCIASLLPCTETHILLTSHIKHGDFQHGVLVTVSHVCVCSVLSFREYGECYMVAAFRTYFSCVRKISNNGSRTRKQRE